MRHLTPKNSYEKITVRVVIVFVVIASFSLRFTSFGQDDSEVDIGRDYDVSIQNSGSISGYWFCFNLEETSMKGKEQQLELSDLPPLIEVERKARAYFGDVLWAKYYFKKNPTRPELTWKDFEKHLDLVSISLYLEGDGQAYYLVVYNYPVGMTVNHVKIPVFTNKEIPIPIEGKKDNR